MADESMELEQQPRTQATDEGEEEYAEVNEATGADDDDDVEFVESRPSVRDEEYEVDGEGEEEEEEEEDEEEDQVAVGADYYQHGSAGMHRQTAGKTPAVNGGASMGHGFGAQHDEDFARRVIHVAVHERGWNPDEVGDVVSLLFATLRYDNKPAKVQHFLASCEAPIEDPGFFASLNRDSVWMSGREIVSLASRDLERDDFCNALPRFVAENAVDLLSAGAVDQIVSVVLGRTDLDEEEQVELLRNVAAVAADEARRRAMVLAVERGLDDDRLKQRFFSLLPGAEKYLSEEGRADKPISIDDDDEEEAGKEQQEEEGDGLEDEEAAGPVLAPEPSLAREESMGLNGVLAKGGDVPLEVPLAAGEDDEEQRADMQRVDSFKRKWPGEESEEEVEHFRLKGSSGGMAVNDDDEAALGGAGGGGGSDNEPVLNREDSFNVLEDMA